MLLLSCDILIDYFHQAYFDLDNQFP